VADLQQPNPPRSPLDGGQLRDIVEASVDAPPVTLAGRSARAAEVLSVLPESVIGADERVRVFDTHLYPFSAIAALEITARDGSLYVGTGWFVGKHTLITAGHCVFVRDPKRPTANGWVRSIRVIPGRNGRGPGSEPFGSVTATRFRSVSGWVEKGNADSDYGAIFLPPGSTPNGAQVGQLGMKAYGDAALQALSLNVAGYPADKKGNEAQTLWFDVKRTAQVRPRQVFYDADTFGGQSGAPVFEVDGAARRVVAIHAYGVSMGEKSNSGTRITAEVFKRIQEWKDS
ncbi:MAG TPA: serine protease, partial [Longimicrobium sp.]|nr:serine protease [Longimicrobium sp.]